MRTRHLLSLLLAFICSGVHADHFAGGTITTRCTGNNFHEITLRLFRSCDGMALLPQTLDFSNSCGVVFNRTGLLPDTTEDATSLCAAQLGNSSCNGGVLPGFDVSTYRTTVYLSPCARWVISWNTCCRSYTTNLLDGPGLYIETVVDNAGGLCNAAPEFTKSTVPLVCAGQPVEFDASAQETEGHTLHYALIPARFGSPAPLPVQYATGYSGSAPFTGMAIDPNTGLISFTPTLIGAIVVVVEVTETNSAGRVLGTVMNDFLFVVTNCSNTPPSTDSGTFTDASGPAAITQDRELSVCGADPFCASITIADANTGQQLTLTTDAATALPGATVEITGTNPAVAELCWSDAPSGVHAFSITATDDGCPVPGVRTYHFRVTVAPPPSAGENASISTCENGQAFAMIDHLGGAPDGGGHWVDPEGTITDGIFRPGLSLTGIHTYTVGAAPCEASAMLSVVAQPASDPECLTAGIIGAQHSALSMQPDGVDPHRCWLTSPAMNATLRILSADGRLLTDGRFVAPGTTPTAIDIPSTHHGHALIQLQDEATGARYVLRTVVP
ncbi:MAG: hypothetical protein KF797_11985 [Flavobacteriales bacterium]|nr:hypothetical protein [Flavobacteriales bacterium]